MNNKIKFKKGKYLSLLKYTVSILFIYFFFCGQAFASTYYISTTDGNDTCTGLSQTVYSTGLTACPIKTITKVNTLNLIPGDNILFKKGNTFYGSITIKKSGTAGNPITFSSYGEGGQPIITGFTDVTSWTNLGSNIWESTNAVSTLSNLNIVLIGEINTPMGRTPNLGSFYFFQSHNGISSITSSDLTGNPNWTGATAVIRKNGWTWQESIIDSQSGGTINYTNIDTRKNNDIQYIPKDGSGFFIQKDIDTLDTQNEWYYNGATKKLSIYSSSQPTGVKVPTISTLFNVDYTTSYINIDGIFFTGANSKGMYINTSDNINVTNCTFNQIGLYGVDTYESNYYIIDNNFFNEINHMAINIGDKSNNDEITNNTITNTYMIQGVGGLYPQGAIVMNANNSLVQYNTIDYSGYNGIMALSNNGLVKNNFINHSMQKTSDGGGIYTRGAHTDLVIEDNIALNPLGHPLGYNYAGAKGIYLDINTTNVTVRNNTAAGGSVGLSMSSYNSNNTFDGNTSFDNDDNLYISNFSKSASSIGMTNSNTVTNNKFVTKNSTDNIVHFQSSYAGDVEKFFSIIDNNIYARPINDTDTIWYYQPSIVGLKNSQPLSQWKTFIGKDSNSKKSPVAVSSESDIFFEYNATKSNKTVTLPWTAVDMNGTKQSAGSITIAPYSSVIYLKDSNPVTSFALTINKQGTGSGTVTGASTYNSGTIVTATQIASTGSTFIGWSGDCNASGVVTMSADKTCVATFNLVLTSASAGGGGGGGGGSSSGGGGGSSPSVSAINPTTTPAVIPSLVPQTPPTSVTLVTQVPVVTIPVNTPSVYFTSRMLRGFKGDEVKELQKILISKGYLTGIADGSFGRGTESAVKQFQIANSLTPDGIIGVKGRAILNTSLANSVPTVSQPTTTTPTVVTTPITQLTKRLIYHSKLNDYDEVKTLQSILISKGYLPSTSTVDGVFGRGTLAAVKSFQNANNLVPDGVVGKGTREYLNK